MTSFRGSNDLPLRESHEKQEPFGQLMEPTTSRWRIFLPNFKSHRQSSNSELSSDRASEKKMKPAKWSLGILNDPDTEEVPGKSTFSSREEKSCCENSAMLFLPVLTKAASDSVL